MHSRRVTRTFQSMFCAKVSYFKDFLVTQEKAAKRLSGSGSNCSCHYVGRHFLLRRQIEGRQTLLGPSLLVPKLSRNSRRRRRRDLPGPERAVGLRSLQMKQLSSLTGWLGMSENGSTCSRDATVLDSVAAIPCSSLTRSLPSH